MLGIEFHGSVCVESADEKFRTRFGAVPINSSKLARHSGLRYFCATVATEKYVIRGFGIGGTSQFQHGTFSYGSSGARGDGDKLGDASTRRHFSDGNVLESTASKQKDFTS